MKYELGLVLERVEQPVKLLTYSLIAW